MSELLNYIKVFIITYIKYFQIIYFSINVIIGFIIGLYLSKNDVPISDFITCLFSLALVFFSWVQSNIGKIQLIIADKQLEYGNLQYKLALEQSYATVITEVRHEDPHFYIIRNVGNRSAHNVHCIIYNDTLNDEYPYEIIEELYSRSMVREYFPDSWLPLNNVILSITIEYEVEEDGRVKRYYYDEFQF